MDQMITLIECLGLAAGMLTTFSFLPQAIKILQTRDVSSISLLMYTIFCLGVVLWLVYGIALGSIALIIANGITLCFSSSILFLKIYIGREKKSE
jgi:MtN3 and saliva related transmembrane protein